MVKMNTQRLLVDCSYSFLLKKEDEELTLLLMQKPNVTMELLSALFLMVTYLFKSIQRC